MNNSNLWYTEKNVLDLFGYSTKSSVYGIRSKVKTMKLSNRYLYLRKDIYELLKERFTTLEECKCVRVALDAILDYDIDLDVWIPLKGALKIVPFSRQRLYQLKNSGKVNTITYDSFTLFNKEELNDLARK